MQQVDKDFSRLLGDRWLERLDAYPDSIYGIWGDHRIAYLNPAWFRFAARNNGEPDISEHWGIGTSLRECIPEVLKLFFDYHFEKVLKSQVPWSHSYECSSDQTFRKFHQTVYPVRKEQGFLIVNTQVLETRINPINRPACEADEARYMDRRGRIQQCCNCRRVMLQEDKDRCDWVPAWVKNPHPDLVHMLCSSCAPAYATKHQEVS